MPTYGASQGVLNGLNDYQTRQINQQNLEEAKRKLAMLDAQNAAKGRYVQAAGYGLQTPPMPGQASVSSQSNTPAPQQGGGNPVIPPYKTVTGISQDVRLPNSPAGGGAPQYGSNPPTPQYGSNPPTPQYGSNPPTPQGVQRLPSIPEAIANMRARNVSEEDMVGGLEMLKNAYKMQDDYEMRGENAFRDKANVESQAGNLAQRIKEFESLDQSRKDKQTKDAKDGVDDAEIPKSVKGMIRSGAPTSVWSPGLGGKANGALRIKALNVAAKDMVAAGEAPDEETAGELIARRQILYNADKAAGVNARRRELSVEDSQQNIESMIDVVKDTLKDAGLDTPKLVNMPMNAVRTYLSDVEFGKFKTALTLLSEKNGKYLVGGTGSVAQLTAGGQKLADALLNSDMPVGLIVGNTDIIRREISNSRKITTGLREDLGKPKYFGDKNTTPITEVDNKPSPTADLPPNVPTTNSKGWELHQNPLTKKWAYLGPDFKTDRSQFEEVK